MAKRVKRKTAEAIAEVMQQISAEPNLLQSLITTLGDKGTARLGAAKKLQLISQANPSLLYPHFDVFAKLLDNPSSVMLWNGIIILSHLVSVDTEKRFDDVFNSYYRHLWDGKLVTAANILGSSGRIAQHRPDLACRITTEILKVDDIPFPTAECREVARGHALSSLAEYLEVLSNNQSVRDFITRCTASHRPPVRRQAEELLDRMHPA